MKALTATALLLALSAVALAKPNPVERSSLAFANADLNVGSLGAMRENIGSVGAMRERDYFEAPQPPFDAGAFPCRLEPVPEDAPSPIVPLKKAIGACGEGRLLVNCHPAGSVLGRRDLFHFFPTNIIR